MFEYLVPIWWLFGKSFVAFPVFSILCFEVQDVSSQPLSWLPCLCPTTMSFYSSKNINSNKLSHLYVASVMIFDHSNRRVTCYKQVSWLNPQLAERLVLLNILL